MITATVSVLSKPRLIPILSVAVGLLLAVYVALMISAILFAALQTQLAQNVQDKQMEIGKLENSYYTAIAKLDQTDPASLGFVKPSHVAYVTQSPLPGFAIAHN